MSDFLASWGPTIVLFAIVLIAVEFAVAKQIKVIRTANENRAQQTEELKKISQSLERVAAALEKRA